MKHPFLNWAISQSLLRQEEVAGLCSMSPSRLSRCLTGKMNFEAKEREALSKLLGYSDGFLFQEVQLPTNERLLHAEAIVDKSSDLQELRETLIRGGEDEKRATLIAASVGS